MHTEPNWPKGRHTFTTEFRRNLAPFVAEVAVVAASHPEGSLSWFRNSRKPADLASQLAIFSMEDRADIASAWVYDWVTLFHRTDGRFEAHSYQDVFIGNRSDAEAFLYFEFYAPECVEWSINGLDAMVTLLEDWCLHHGIHHEDASEILAKHFGLPDNAATRRRIQWLEWFIRTWEEVESRHG